MTPNPLRRYFGGAFDGLARRLDALEERARGRDAQLGALGQLLEERVPRPAAGPAQEELLARVDLTRHNAGTSPPTLAAPTSQAASAAQFAEAEFVRWSGLFSRSSPTDDTFGRVREPERPHRKLWEWVFVLRAAEQAGVLRPGASALGFGVGTEPVPAALARQGVEVLATDQPAGQAGQWAASGQHGESIDGLRQPAIVDDGELRRLVRFRPVDMNALPDDLGTFDLVWSSCCIEHLGSPARGLDFVVESCRLLRPGGLVVHTTELELTARRETADWGHCAVYRIDDLEALAARLPSVGCRTELNFHVAMETPADRFVSPALIGGDPAEDLAHLKLVIGDSISTSFGLLIRKDAD